MGDRIRISFRVPGFKLEGDIFLFTTSSLCVHSYYNVTMYGRLKSSGRWPRQMDAEAIAAEVEREHGILAQNYHSPPFKDFDLQIFVKVSPIEPKSILEAHRQGFT